MLNKKLFSSYLLFLIMISNSYADENKELFEANQKQKKIISSLEMDCSQWTPQCDERISAVKASEEFDIIFNLVLERNIELWPGDEISIVKSSLEIRKQADKLFTSQFYGQSSIKYTEANELLDKMLEKTTENVELWVGLGEKYLYVNEKPDWAISYFNQAAPYAPKDERIKSGLARIKFLRDYENDMILVDNYILSNQFDLALPILNELLDGDPGNKEMLKKKQQAETSIRKERIKTLTKSYQEAYEGGERMELLKKIDNTVLLYKDQVNDMLPLIALKEKILSELRQTQYDSLETNFIDGKMPIIDLFDKAKELDKQYPNDEQIEVLLKKIKTSYEIANYQKKYKEAGNNLESENWKIALDIFSELVDCCISIEGVDNSSLTKEFNQVKQINDIYNSLNKILDNSIQELNTISKIESAKDIILRANNIDLIKASPSFKKTIDDVNNKIITYESIVKAENKKPPSKPAKRPVVVKTKKPVKTKEPSSSPQQNDPPKKSPGNNIGLIKAKLVLSSYNREVVCKKRTRNKKMVLRFEISLSPTGKALSVKLVNKDEVKPSSRDNEAIVIAQKALKKSKYLPATKNGINVSSIFFQRLAIPKGYCE
jgi:hypothetical protein